MILLRKTEVFRFKYCSQVIVDFKTAHEMYDNLSERAG